MKSCKSEFKLITRGFNKVIILIPGWATDYRVFSGLDLDYNYLFPTQLNPFDFKARLGDYLDRASIEKVSLFGWSLGAFLAADFASSDHRRIDSLYLVSVRKKYDSGALFAIMAKLKKNKQAYLYKFYQDCFSGRSDNGDFNRFKEGLLPYYTKNMRLEDLILGLEYLVESELRPELLKSIKKVRIYHGDCDKIVPAEEILDLKHEVSCLGLINISFILFSGLGHAPFLSQLFKEKFYDG